MNFLKTLTITCALLFYAPMLFANDEKTGTGTVVETMTTGTYVYVRLKEGDAWIASSNTPVQVGDKVKYYGGNTMKDFTSRTLQRSFEYIIFAGRLEVINEVNADSHANAPTNDPHTVAKSAAAVAPTAGEITPLDGGKTIADVHTNRDQLKDQQIALRARVMKVSLEISGKNWITLQDGTGTAPNNKLIATTSEVVTVGDLVTATGVVHTDVDLGSGYNYSVLLEEATFTK
jgi:hypothetical protein